MSRELTFIPDTVIGRRRDRRRSVHLPATIVMEGRNVAGAISDISESGAKLRLRGQDGGSEQVLIEVEDHRFEARIMWRDDGAIGILFEDEIPSAIVDGLAKLSGRNR